MLASVTVHNIAFHSTKSAYFHNAKSAHIHTIIPKMCVFTYESHIFVAQKSFAHSIETYIIKKLSSRAEFRVVAHGVNSKAGMFAKHFCVLENVQMNGRIAHSDCAKMCTFWSIILKMCDSTIHLHIEQSTKPN